MSTAVNVPDKKEKEAAYFVCYTRRWTMISPRLVDAILFLFQTVQNKMIPPKYWVLLLFNFAFYLQPENVYKRDYAGLQYFYEVSWTQYNLLFVGDLN